MAHSGAMKKNNTDSAPAVRTKSGVAANPANNGAAKQLAILMLTGTLFFKRIFSKKEQNTSPDE